MFRRYVAPALGVFRRCLSSKVENPTLANITHNTVSGRKRFYKHVGVGKVEGREGYYNVLLDGRVLKSPARGKFELPSQDLACIIAAEWDAQTNERVGIQPTSMPCMTIAATAIDQVIPSRDFVQKTCISYLPTDTALFYTSPDDRLLLRKQQKHFKPLLKWVNNHYDIELVEAASDACTGKIVHPETSIDIINKEMDKMDPFTLSCLQCVTMECKSIIMALGLLNGKLSMEELIECSRLEEEFQAEIWGVVEGGHDLDRLHNKIRISSALVVHNCIKNNAQLL